jgi:2-polyprenyl-3-methyl-5-hydroxy-6-metoxy-1,4-benzoquinol methylase
MRWNKKAFDANYYKAGARGGFKNYEYAHPDQQTQLQIKWDLLQNSFGKVDSILFVGCAQGFEVKYFREKGVQAYGVDVSDWAIDNCEPESRHYVASYDGFNFPDYQFKFDVVAHFDVMALVPKERRSEFIRNSTDLTKNGYFFRTHISNHREPENEDGFNGIDGAFYTYWSFEKYVEEIEKVGMHFTSAIASSSMETMFTFRK